MVNVRDTFVYASNNGPGVERRRREKVAAVLTDPRPAVATDTHSNGRIEVGLSCACRAIRYFVPVREPPLCVLVLRLYRRNCNFSGPVYCAIHT